MVMVRSRMDRSRKETTICLAVAVFYLGRILALSCLIIHVQKY